jgi:uncharacterized cupin superfamily protein
MPAINVEDLKFEFDPADPEGFRAAMARLGPALGARSTGLSVYELPPGQVLCPYHYEYAEEEWLLVLSGTPSLRTPEGVEQLKPLDLAFFATGPDGAHQVRNDGAEPARVALFSNVVLPAATAYPDSGKVGIYTDVPGERRLLVKRTSAVDYYEGETP